MYIKDAVGYLASKNVFITRKLKEYGVPKEKLHAINVYATIVVAMIYAAREEGLVWQKSFSDLTYVIESENLPRFKHFLNYLVEAGLLEIIKQGRTQLYQPVMGKNIEINRRYISTDLSKTPDVINMGVLQSPCKPQTAADHNRPINENKLWGYTLIAFDTLPFVGNKPLNPIYFHSTTRDNWLLKANWLVINKVRKIRFELITTKFWEEITEKFIKDNDMSYALDKPLPDFRKLSPKFFDPLSSNKEKSNEYMELIKESFAKSGEEFVYMSSKNKPTTTSDIVTLKQQAAKPANKIVQVAAQRANAPVTKPVSPPVRINTPIKPEPPTVTNQPQFKNTVLKEIYEILISNLNEDLKLKLITNLK